MTTLLGVASTFSYTANVQEYTVPSGINSVIMYACGAQGGTNTWGKGGYGGCIRSLVFVFPGQLLYVSVGGSGVSTPAGYNGGGYASYSGGGGLWSGGGGGSSWNGGAIIDNAQGVRCPSSSQSCTAFTSGLWTDNLCTSTLNGLCKVPNLCWKLTENTDHSGADLEYYSSSTVDQCKEACYNNPSCVFMVYGPSGHECWLKSTTGGVSTSTTDRSYYELVQCAPTTGSPTSAPVRVPTAAPSQYTQDNSKAGNSLNTTIGVSVGVVGGVLIIIGIIVGYFYCRNPKNKILPVTITRKREIWSR
eukprot:gene10054-20948_t